MVNKATPHRQPHNKVAVAPKPEIIIPQVDESRHYHEIVRCQANRSTYQGSIPGEKLDLLERKVKEYNKVWLNNERYRGPIYKGNFTREAFIKQFPKNGEEMFSQIMQIRNAALPGDASVLSTLPLMDFQNMLSAMVFSGGLLPEQLKRLVETLRGDTGPEAKCRNTPDVESRRTFNKLAQKRGIPVAFLTSAQDGVEAFCLLRLYKYDPHKSK